METQELMSPFDSLTSHVSDHAKSVYLAAFRNILLPIVRTALRHGLAHDELVDSLRRALAECAQEMHRDGDESRKISASQLSILTGIPRRHAERIKATMAIGAAEELSNLNRIGRIIGGWQRDFVGPYGIPLALSLEPGERTFPDLVRRYAGQVAPAEILEELKLVGVVEVNGDGKARLTNRSYITGRLRPESIERMSWTIHDLAETLDFNLDPSREAPARFERRVVTNESIGSSLLTAFQDLVTAEGQGFLERLDNWLNERFQELRKNRRKSGSEEFSSADSRRTRSVGVGVYWFERDEIGA